MAYTYTEMLSMLGMYLSEVNFVPPLPDTFNDTTKAKLLNIAQDKVIGMIKTDYFPDLFVVTAETSLTASGYYDLSGLTYPIFREHFGIIGVETTASNATMCRRMTIAEYLEIIKRQKKTPATLASAYKVYCYIIGTYLYVYPNDGATTKIIIYYLRKPATIRSLVTTAATGTGTVATITFATQNAAPFVVGSAITVSGVTPAGYNQVGATVTACTTTTVSYANTTTGSQTVAGNIYQNCELADEVQDLIIDYAAYLGYKMGNAYERAKMNWDELIAQVTMINRRFDPEWAYIPETAREANLEENLRGSSGG